MRTASLAAAAIVGAVVVVITNCSDEPQCNAEFDMSAAAGCVDFLTVDCSFEGGAFAPAPLLSTQRCDGQVGGSVFATITMNANQPMTCTTIITCANGDVQMVNVEFACDSAFSPSLGLTINPAPICTSLADGGMDAAIDASVDVSEPDDDAMSDADTLDASDAVD